MPVRPRCQFSLCAITAQPWFLLDDESNFQLFRAANPGLTFIFSNHNNAAYFGDRDMKIFDFGQNNTLRFSEEQGRVDVFGFDHDLTGYIGNLQQQLRIAIRAANSWHAREAFCGNYGQTRPDGISYTNRWSQRGAGGSR